jgi:hypothetical protein
LRLLSSVLLSSEGCDCLVDDFKRTLGGVRADLDGFVGAVALKGSCGNPWSFFAVS